MSLAYRPAELADLGFVVGTWLDSFRSSEHAGLIAMDDWQTVMEPQVKRVLQRPGVDCWVAYHPGETEHTADLYAWIAVERGYDMVSNDYINGKYVRRTVRSDVPLILYAYTKQNYRREGICRGLFKAAGIGERWNYAAHTRALAELKKKGKVPAGSRYLPLVPRFPKGKCK
jgi:hypothetical protein